MHLTVEIYRLMLRGVLEPWQLVKLAHHHAVEECDQCREELEQLGLDGEVGPWAGVEPRPRGRQGGPGQELVVPPQPEDPDALSIQDHEVWKDLVSRMRAETRKAREDVKQLLELPSEEWRERIETSRTRFQSRAFAQHLLRESRTRVRDEPAVAARLAALVPVALRWAPGDCSWARALRARAEAYRANADRVAGDLPASSRRFATLRRRLRQHPLTDAAALAEIDSLEASLCIDRRRFREAERLLGTAADGARGAGHRSLLQRILIQTANLHGAQGEPERQLAALEAAARELEPDDASYEHLCLITSQVLALCDLERFDRAAERLERAASLFEGQEHAEATLAGLRGRLALARGHIV